MLTITKDMGQLRDLKGGEDSQVQIMLSVNHPMLLRTISYNSNLKGQSTNGENFLFIIHRDLP